MSRAREFPAEELEEIRQDWERTGHKLGMVAQLHGCNTERILKALGMEAVEIKRKKPAWEETNPEKAKAFAVLMLNGATVKEASKAVGLKYQMGYNVWNRMKGKIDMSKANEAPAPETAAEPITPEDYEVETVESVESPAKAEKKDVCAVIFSQISAVTELVDLLDENQMLSDEERNFCEKFIDRADAFMKGVEYARKGQ